MMFPSYDLIGDIFSLSTLIIFIIFYSSVPPKNEFDESSSSPSSSNRRLRQRSVSRGNEKEQTNQYDSERLRDIIFFRKGSQFSFHEINKTFALAGLTLLSIGLAGKSIHRYSSSTTETDTTTITVINLISSRIAFHGCLLARFHGMYSAIEFVRRFSPKSKFLGAMLLGVFTFCSISLVLSHPDHLILELAFPNSKFVRTFIDFGKENFENSALIVIALAVGHFISIDTTIDRRVVKKKKKSSNKKQEDEEDDDIQFEMSLRPFGYTALIASCVGALMIWVNSLM